jgi:hypothetical protein
MQQRWYQVARWFVCKSKIKILEGLEMENVGIIYDHLEYLKAIWYTLWPFGIFSGYLVHFYQYWCVVRRKIWQP